MNVPIKLKYLLSEEILLENNLLTIDKLFDASKLTDEEKLRYKNQILSLDKSGTKTVALKFVKFFLENPTEQQLRRIESEYNAWDSLRKRQLFKQDINSFKTFKDFFNKVHELNAADMLKKQQAVAPAPTSSGSMEVGGTVTIPQKVLHMVKALLIGVQVGTKIIIITIIGWKMRKLCSMYIFWIESILTQRIKQTSFILDWMKMMTLVILPAVTTNQPSLWIFSRNLQS